MTVIVSDSGHCCCVLCRTYDVFRTQHILGRGVAQFVQRWTGTPLTQVRFPGAARDFSPRVHFQCRLSYGVRTHPCAYINICTHIKDPVVHVRVQWIMEILKHPACTVGLVARLCHSWLFPGKATQISHGRNLIGTIQL